MIKQNSSVHITDNACISSGSGEHPMTELRLVAVLVMTMGVVGCGSDDPNIAGPTKDKNLTQVELNDIVLEKIQAYADRGAPAGL